MSFDKALVTGASSGIGEALARLLASKGIPLILTGRNTDKLETLAKELGNQVSVTWIVADLGKPTERQRLVTLIQAEAPQLVVNNAGFGLYGSLLTKPTSAELDMVYVNVEAVVDLTIEAVKALVAASKQGTVMNVSSAAAFQPFPNSTIYGATKAFVNMFSEGFDAEVSDQGIRVLAACPGFVETAFRRRAGGSGSPISAMTAEYAAAQIWLQIERGIPVRIFDWKYRLAIFAGRFVPNSLITKILRWSLKSRHTPQQPKADK